MRKAIVKDAWTVVDSRQLSEVLGYIPDVNNVDEYSGSVEHIYLSRANEKWYHLICLCSGLGANDLWNIKEHSEPIIISDAEKEDRKDRYEEDRQDYLNSLNLKPEWCSDPECEAEEYFGDGECRCGIHKHHYHCSKHGKVVQIG